jgi:hypothetical protein
MKMEQTEWCETLANKIPTLGIHPKERIQQLQHGKRSKSRKVFIYYSGYKMLRGILL